MDSQESNRREVGQFFGLVKDISPYDQPLGSFLELTNLTGVVPGEIRTRKGTAPATDFTGTPGSSDILSLWAYNSPLGPTVITHDSGGSVKARRDGASITLATGISTAVPLRYAVTRDNQLIFVNGLQRGKIWPGTNAAALNLGVDPPTAAIADADITMDSGGGASAGTYLIAQQFVDYNNLRTDPALSEVSAVRSKVATDSQKFTYDSSDLEDPAGRGTHRRIWRTTVGESSVFYRIVEQAVGETVDYDDVFTDQALIDAAAEDPEKLILLRGRFGVIMRRFTPPPKTKSVAVVYKDRVFYGVDVPYETGTVSITSADATLTGVGTTWTSDFVGRYVWIDGAAKPYKILSFTNSTSVELTPTPAESLSGKAYQILPDPAERNQVYYSALDEPESVHATFAIRVQAAPEDSGTDTALMPMGGSLFIFRQSHAYAFSFSKEPNYDGSSQHAFARGCLNQSCWDQYDGNAYVMDRNGAYVVGPGGSVDPISDVIQSYWRDGTIDFEKATWFSVNVDPSDKIARFFVNFTTDSATRPCRALCFHVLHRTWHIEEWPNEWSNAVRVEVDGDPKTVIGGKADRLYFLGSGELDGCSSEHSGTVTSATSTTLTNSGATFGSSNGLIGASVAIYAGTGFGQVRRITANTGTQLTVATWTTTPDTTSKYVVGGASYRAKMAYQPLIDQARKEEENTSTHLVVQPITDDRPVHVRAYFDFDESAQTLGSTSNSADQLVSWTKGSPDKVFSINKTAKTNDAGTGTNRGKVTLFDFSKSGGSRLQGKSYVAVELEGVKSDEQIVFHKIAISGTGK